MKKIKFTAVLLTVAAMALGITACGNKFDAKTYVKGNLDANFKNEISDDFAKLTEGGKEGIEAAYNDAIQVELDQFKAAGCSEQAIEDYKTAYQGLMKNYKYSVGEPVKGENDGFTVPVEVTPLKMDVDQLAVDAQEFIMGLIAEGLDTANETELMDKMLGFITEKMNEVVANPTYGDPTTIEVKVVKVSDNMYEIPVKDQESVANAMLSE